jgi:hypothetical protein
MTSNEIEIETETETNASAEPGVVSPITSSELDTVPKSSSPPAIEHVFTTSEYDLSKTIQYVNNIFMIITNYHFFDLAIAFSITAVKLVARILANIFIMLLGWTIDASTQDYLTHNVSNVIMCSTGKWNMVIIMVYRAALGITGPYFSSNAPNENTLLGKIITYLFNYRNLTNINSYDNPYYLEINELSVQLILPNIGNPVWIALNYNNHSISINNSLISTDQAKIGVPLGAPNILTSLFNWKTALFVACTIYSMLYVLGFLFTIPIAMVLWAIWRNTLLTVNQTATVLTAVNVPVKAILDTENVKHLD